MEWELIQCGPVVTPQWPLEVPGSKLGNRSCSLRINIGVTPSPPPPPASPPPPPATPHRAGITSAPWLSHHWTGRGVRFSHYWLVLYYRQLYGRCHGERGWYRASAGSCRVPGAQILLGFNMIFKETSRRPFAVLSSGYSGWTCLNRKGMSAHKRGYIVRTQRRKERSM